MAERDILKIFFSADWANCRGLPAHLAWLSNLVHPCCIKNTTSPVVMGNLDATIRDHANEKRPQYVRLFLNSRQSWRGTVC